MKNRKSLFALVLVVMVLILGVGYAVVNSVDLVISGTASAKTTDLDVVITAATPNDTTADVYGTVSNPADLTATIKVANMVEVGEKQTVTYTIKNNEKDVSAKITEKTIVPASNAFFKVTTDLGTEGITIGAGSTGTVTVTVELTKLPIESTDSEVDVTVTLKAEAAQA